MIHKSRIMVERNVVFRQEEADGLVQLLLTIVLIYSCQMVLGFGKKREEA